MGWTGLRPAKVLQINSFGNLIVQDTNGAIWRICPEELKCEKIANDFDGFTQIWNDSAFRLGWEMTKMVVLAEKKIGRFGEGRSYCFKLSSALGGKYDAENLGEISLLELIAFSGDIAHQVKDVPDGGQIEIKWTA